MKKKMSISELAKHTGLDRRTVAARLEPLTPEKRRGAHLYESNEALPLLVTQTEPEAEQSVTLESDSEWTTKIFYLSFHKKNLKLSSIHDFDEEWEYTRQELREKFLAIPKNLRRQCPEITSSQIAVLELYIREILEELAKYS